MPYSKVLISNLTIVFECYLVVHKVTPHEENKQFSLPRHGNAKHPHAPPYFRQDPAIVAAIDKNCKQDGRLKKYI